MTTGFDYTDRIDPAALKAAGCSAVSRYVTRPDWPKSLTKAEADELLAAGVPICCNFESTADRMRGGGPAGTADAVEARGHMDALGTPGGITVWFSADWDVQTSEIQAALDYLHAAAAALGSPSLVGCYGGYRMVKAAADAGFRIWQTVAWSGGQWDPRAVMRQTGEQRYVGGVQVDVNEIINLGALGAWSLGGTTVGKIPESIGQKWPGIASEFQAGATFDDETALIWADAGAREAARASNAAWLAAQQAHDAVDALRTDLDATSAATKAELDALSGKLDQVLAALKSVPAGGVDPAVVAGDVVHDLAADLAKGGA